MQAKARLGTLITIKNMDRAIRFYTRTLGGKLTFRGRGEMRNFWASLELGGTPLWLVSPERTERRKLAYNVLFVGDIRKTVADLKKRKVRFTPADRMSKETRVEGPIAFDSFGASAFFRDSEGNLLMLWQDGTAA